MRTTVLPLCTVLGDKMETVTGEGPTIMKGPYDLDIGGIQILEQQPIVQIMVVYVVQLNNIGRDGLDRCYELLGRPTGT